MRRTSIFVLLGVVASLLFSLSVQPEARGAAVALSPLSDRRVATGWIPWWRLDAGVASVVATPDVFTEVSPFWYTATPHATVVPQDHKQPAESVLISAIQNLHAVGVRALPTVNDTGMDASSMAALLSDPTSRTALIASLSSMVQRVGADGVDIDFEGMNFGPGTDRTTVRKKFPVFLGELQQSLHTQGSLLSVSVPARLSSTDPNWEVYDYAAIAPNVDRVRVLTYDYSYAGSDPGPVAPAGWVDSVAKYARSEFGKVPVSMGQPAYGYNWYIKTLSGTCPAGTGEKTTAVPTTQQALALADQYNVTPVWDKTSGEYHFTYHRPYPDGGSDCVVLREVWFEDARSVKTKLGIVAPRHVQGLAFWTLGVEDPRSWDVIHRFAASLTPAPAVSTLHAPGALGYGAQLTLSGTFHAGGQPIVNQAVDIQRRVPGGSWVTVDSTTTNGLGAAGYATTATRTYEWRLRVAPGWDWSAGATGAARVLVRHVVTATLQDSTVAPGANFVINGTLAPGESGVTVVRQRLKAGTWVDGPKVATTSGGAFRIRGVAPAAGNWTYRVLAVSDGRHGSGASDPLVLTVG